MGRCPFQAVTDTQDVIGRIRLMIGRPGNFLRKHHITVYDGGTFAIAPTQVIADTTSRRLVVERRVGCRFCATLERISQLKAQIAVIHGLGKELKIKRSGPTDPVSFPKMR